MLTSLPTPTVGSALFDVTLNSAYHFPLETPIVEIELSSALSKVTAKFPSLKLGSCVAVPDLWIGFNVAKLFVQVSVLWSVAVRLVTVKLFEFPDVSKPKFELSSKSK